MILRFFYDIPLVNFFIFFAFSNISSNRCMACPCICFKDDTPFSESTMWEAFSNELKEEKEKLKKIDDLKKKFMDKYHSYSNFDEKSFE